MPRPFDDFFVPIEFYIMHKDDGRKEDVFEEAFGPSILVKDEDLTKNPQLLVCVPVVSTGNANRHDNDGGDDTDSTSDSTNTGVVLTADDEDGVHDEYYC